MKQLLNEMNEVYKLNEAGDLKIEVEYVVSAFEFFKKYTKQRDADEGEVFTWIEEDGWKFVAQEVKKLLAGTNIRMGETRFEETDSGNLGHAGAYYTIELIGQKKELQKVAGENEELMYNWRP